MTGPKLDLGAPWAKKPVGWVDEAAAGVLPMGPPSPGSGPAMPVVLPMVADEVAVPMGPPPPVGAGAGMVLDPGPAVVEPRGRGFDEAFRFVLGQEVPVGDRAHPGEVLLSGSDGDAGIDPIAQRETARRNPDIWRRSEEAALASVEAPEGVGTRAPMANHLRNVYADIWNASGAGEVGDERLALVLFDTAVQYGADSAKAMMAEADGDPDRFVDLREARYRERMAAPNAHEPVGFFREAPAHQRGWVEQRIPALREAIRRPLRGLARVVGQGGGNEE